MSNHSCPNAVWSSRGSPLWAVSHGHSECSATMHPNKYLVEAIKMWLDVVTRTHTTIGQHSKFLALENETQKLQLPRPEINLMLAAAVLNQLRFFCMHLYFGLVSFHFELRVGLFACCCSFFSLYLFGFSQIFTVIWLIASPNDARGLPCSPITLTAYP